MVVYNFKRIQPVPTNKQFVDIVLTRVRGGQRGLSAGRITALSESTRDERANAGIPLCLLWRVRRSTYPLVLVPA